MLSVGGERMICGSCGKRMKIGKFQVSVHGVGAMSAYAYPEIEWYEDDMHNDIKRIDITID